MSAPFIILLVGFLYTIFFGGLTFIRREGLSLRFALEATGVTLLFSALGFFYNIIIEPILFLLIIYVITMRVRILVDLANLLARRRNFTAADKIYDFTSKLWPDKTNLLIIDVNKGTSLLQQGQLDDAISVFKTILARTEQGYLGIKYETATHYNLGVAYHRKNLSSLATQEFETVIEIWPGSVYSRYAEAALERLQKTKD